MKKWTILTSLLVIFALVLGACADTDNTGDDTGLEGVATEAGLENDNTNATTNANDDGEDDDDANENANVNANANGNEGVEATATPTLSATEVLTGTTGEAIMDEDDPSRASNLLDFVVKNYEEETIGEVADIIVNSGSEQITYVIVESGGFLGLGENQVAVPYTAMTLGGEAGNANTATTGTFEDERAFYLDIDEETLGSAPDVDLDELDFTVADWDTEFATWWANFEAGVIEATDGDDDNDNANANANANDDAEDNDDDGEDDDDADDDDTDENANGNANEATTNEDQLAGPPVAILMTALLEAEVVNVTAASMTSGESTETNDNANANANGNANTNASDTTAAAEGEEMGFVAEVIVEPTTGAVEYVVVEAGAELDLETTAWIPVPLSQLEIVLEEAGDDDYVVFIQRDTLAGAPSFEVGNLPAFEADWDAGLRDYWQTQ